MKNLKECFDGEPPYIDFPPLRALFLIQTKGLPPLLNASKQAIEFYELCIKMGNKSEPLNFLKLFYHPFIIGLSSNQDAEDSEVRSTLQASIIQAKKLRTFLNQY